MACMEATKSRSARCALCGRKMDVRTTQRIYVCGECPDSAEWQQIWHQVRSERSALERQPAPRR